MRRSCVAVLCLLCSCRTTPLPSVPSPSLDDFLPAVREQIASAGEAARASPTDPELVGRYGMVLLAHDQFTLAAQCFERARRLQPTHFRWAYYSGLAYQSAGKNGEAATAIAAALRIRPDYVPGLLRLAALTLSLGEALQSKAACERVLKQQPNSAAAHFGLARALAAQRNHTGALEAFEAACKLFPQYSAAHYAAAQLSRHVGDHTAAERHTRAYKASNRMAPPSADVYLEKLERLNAGAQTHVESSLQLANAGRLEEAAEANLQALRVDPNLVQAHVNLISLYGRLKKPQRAEQHYKKAIGLTPNRADAHYNYGVLSFSLGRMDRALSAFGKAVQANPKHADAQTNLAYLLEMRGRRREAVTHYQAALEVAPAHRLARYHMGRILIATGRPQAAVLHFQRIAEPQDEGTPEILYGLATAYVRSGDLHNGLLYTRRAFQLAQRYKQTKLAERLRRDVRVLEARIRP